MTWFIQQYLPEAMDLKTPEASVLFAESPRGLAADSATRRWV